MSKISRNKVMLARRRRRSRSRAEALTYAKDIALLTADVIRGIKAIEAITAKSNAVTAKANAAAIGLDVAFERDKTGYMLSDGTFVIEANEAGLVDR